MKTIAYDDYMEIFKKSITVLHGAVNQAKNNPKDYDPEDYDHAVRLLIHAVVKELAK